MRLLLVLALTLVACGGPENDEPDAGVAQTALVGTTMPRPRPRPLPRPADGGTR